MVSCLAGAAAVGACARQRPLVNQWSFAVYGLTQLVAEEVTTLLLASREVPSMGLTRTKQLLMGVGLLTVLGVATMLGLMTYLWYDTRTIDTDTTADFDASVDADTNTGTEFDASVDIDAETKA